MRPHALRIAGAMAAAGALGAVWAAYRRDLARARARVMRSSVVTTACGPIEYASIGTGPVVLVVHGAGGGFDQGLDFAHGFAARGFRVIAMSRFGYLRTPLPPRASPVAQADAHAALLDALGIARATVLGASAGALSAVQFALRHRARTAALVLLVPALHQPHAGGIAVPVLLRGLLAAAVRSDFLWWAARRIAPAALVRMVLGTPWRDVAAAPPAERARVTALLAHVLPIRWRRRGFMHDVATVGALPRYDLENVAVPALVISVENDGFGLFEAGRTTAAAIPRAEFVAYATGGHVWAGHHPDVLARVTDFLARSSASHCLAPAS